MESTQHRARKFGFFALGLAAPIAALVLWNKLAQPGQRKDKIDRAHDLTVEDSFPASDPPSSW